MTEQTERANAYELEQGRGRHRGAARLVSIFLLFWLLAALFLLIDGLAPYDVVLRIFGPQRQSASGLGFAVAIALLGWGSCCWTRCSATSPPPSGSARAAG